MQFSLTSVVSTLLAATPFLRRNPMPQAQKIGPKSNFGRAADLIAINLSSIGATSWRLGVAADYDQLSRAGVKSSDTIVCELDSDLYDCGTLELQFSTQKNMTQLWQFYASGNALQIKWYRLPPQASA